MAILRQGGITNGSISHVQFLNVSSQTVITYFCQVLMAKGAEKYDM